MKQKTCSHRTAAITCEWAWIRHYECSVCWRGFCFSILWTVVSSSWSPLINQCFIIPLALSAWFTRMALATAWPSGTTSFSRMKLVNSWSRHWMRRYLSFGNLTVPSRSTATTSTTADCPCPLTQIFSPSIHSMQQPVYSTHLSRIVSCSRVGAGRSTRYLDCYLSHAITLHRAPVQIQSHWATDLVSYRGQALRHQCAYSADLRPYNISYHCTQEYIFCCHDCE